VYQTEKGTPMWKDILHARIPAASLPGPFTDLLMGYSKKKSGQGFPALDAL
jgi:hypothetical protein